MFASFSRGENSESRVSELNVKDLKRALISAGLEVFRVRDDEVHLAERQNVQLMEAGVRARAGGAPRVTVVARAQRNDAPALNDHALYDAIRHALLPLIDAGYREERAESREIRSVSDDHVLDVWYEVVFVREVASMDEAVSEVKRALSVDRYVVPTKG
jgi:hypothetical protein